MLKLLIVSGLSTLILLFGCGKDPVSTDETPKPVTIRIDGTTLTYSDDTLYIGSDSFIVANTTYDRKLAKYFNWSPSPNVEDRGKQVPDYPYFGFTVNLASIASNANQNTAILHFDSLGGKNYVLCDFDTSYVFAEVEVLIFNLQGDTVASPANNAGLEFMITITEINKYVGFDSLSANLPNMTLSEIQKFYKISEAQVPSDPDTLRPIYPPILTVGYDYLYTICGPGTGAVACIPAWNCTDSNGDLVDQGIYIGLQTTRTPSQTAGDTTIVKAIHLLKLQDSSS